MPKRNTVLIIPPNDPEAVMITELARAIGLQMIVSQQPHGATLDKEPDILGLIKAGGWNRVVVVEMPGPKTEAEIRRLGVELLIIDHHHYTNLDRAHDLRTGKMLPSALEQFLKIFRLNDLRLRELGFSPKLVKGIGILDRGFIWALRTEGYSEKDIKKVLEYSDELMAHVRDPKNEQKYNELARHVWKHRKEWRGFQVVVSQTKVDIRPRISLIVALELKKPTPLIILENKRGLIYVQESKYAMQLFNKFGGFTFGLDRNWGYQNAKGKKPVHLKDVKKFLNTLM